MAEKFRLRALKAPRQVSRQSTRVTSSSTMGRVPLSSIGVGRGVNGLREQRRRKTVVKRVLYLAVAALVAMLILVPTAMAQEMKMEATVEKDLPKSGGVAPGSLVL